MTSKTNRSITSAKRGLQTVIHFFSGLTCIHDEITSGKNPRGKRIIPNSDRATNAFEAVRL